MLKVSVGELIGAQYSKIHLSAALRITSREYIEAGVGKLISFATAANRVEWNSFSGYTAEAGYKIYTRSLPRPGFRPVWWRYGDQSNRRTEARGTMILKVGWAFY
ncbi:MAG: hypothetical protein SH848_06400 [Saprospiraceae bacterium]|nr:hypothetical protein [Saprospiraceae bacterium]MDZ4703538.1 hypothetical protein [Saprospiraceae bacterium]